MFDLVKNFFGFMAYSIFVISMSQITKTQYRIVIQDKIFKVIYKSVKSIKNSPSKYLGYTVYIRYFLARPNS